MCVYIYCIYIYIYIRVILYTSVRLSVCTSVCLSVCLLSVCLSVYTKWDRWGELIPTLPNDLKTIMHSYICWEAPNNSHIQSCRIMDVSRME